MMKRLMLVCLVFVAVVPAGESIDADCQYCSTEGDHGRCYDVVNPNPAIFAYSNCEGIQQCYPYVGGTHCYPACNGNQCYWV